MNNPTTPIAIRPGEMPVLTAPLEGASGVSVGLAAAEVADSDPTVLSLVVEVVMDRESALDEVADAEATLVAGELLESGLDNVLADPVMAADAEVSAPEPVTDEAAETSVVPLTPVKTLVETAVGPSDITLDTAERLPEAAVRASDDALDAVEAPVEAGVITSDDTPATSEPLVEAVVSSDSVAGTAIVLSVRALGDTLAEPSKTENDPPSTGGDELAAG